MFIPTLIFIIYTLEQRVPELLYQLLLHLCIILAHTVLAGPWDLYSQSNLELALGSFV